MDDGLNHQYDVLVVHKVDRFGVMKGWCFAFIHSPFPSSIYPM
jgi:hypothetical protein